MLNLYCLFHKCGNNYIQNVHRIYKNVRFVRSVTPAEAGSIPMHDRWFRTVNVRCRNFGIDTLQEHGLPEMSNVRLLIFTRHPASFVLSAVKYHLRGLEHWAATEPQPELGGIPLAQGLREAPDDAHRQIIVMRQFRWLYERQASLMALLNGAQVKRVKCEDLFTNTTDAYFQEIADFLGLGRRRGFIKALKQASPAFKTNLPSHATGAFQSENPYEKLGRPAKAFYDSEYKVFEETLGYR